MILKRLTKLPLLLLKVLLILFPLGQLIRIELPWPEARLYGQDIIIMAIWLWSYMAIGFKKINWIKIHLFRPIIGFLLIGLVSLLVNFHRFSINEVLVGSLYLWRWLAYVGIYLAALTLDKKESGKIEEYLLLAGGVGVTLGLTQYVLFPNAWPLTAGQWDPHVGRIIGTFLDPGFTGLIYVLLISLLLVKVWNKNFQAKKNYLFYGLLIVAYLALLLTYSRSCYVAFVVGLAIFSLVKRAGKFFVITLAIFLVSLTLLPRPQGEGTKLERESTIWSRLENYQQAWQIIKGHPVFGVGFNLYRYEQRNQGFLGAKWEISHAGAGTDNSFLFVWATTGIFGLGIYLWLWWRIILLGWLNRFQNFGLVLLTSSGSVVVHSFFNNSLFYAWVMIWIWILIGLTERGKRKN
ncbi:hypothetical protein A2160_03905 [Candidatus Beckwithbacteria bacterium RBG_13_42_9]|uniref:O-antigen ligase-related domain-containing protein n=1 Tax=Candidatus Beckwithbacteria bacterium RBG_13_42_9 TaxID=1797457 RepID=A0A1F5E5N0_9BACT|nr:MAG: hypothetical protein A2160_03905 [Candidatus Beckwithbacteria bacterium RBG_13_42_9]